LASAEAAKAAVEAIAAEIKVGSVFEGNWIFQSIRIESLSQMMNCSLRKESLHRSNLSDST